MRILIKQGRVLDPDQELDQVGDLWIEDGRIARGTDALREEDADRIIDARGLWVCPGLIDLHVHFRDPGLTHKETIASGSMAAAAGGFTTVCVMPNTKPVTDCRDVVRYVLSEAARAPYTHVRVVGAITRQQAGQEVAPLEEMKEAGASAFSEDGKSVMNAALMREAMQRTRALNMPVLDHCEDANLAHGCVNDCEAARELGLTGIPAAAEELITARDIQLAAETGARLHICHVSTRGSARILAIAKREGVKVTAEVCPHHFTLNDSMIRLQDPNYKMNPPLRGEEDVRAMKEALANGTIDCIATDHAPHHVSEKDMGMEKAANGIVGLETALALSVSELVKTGVLSPLELIRKMSTNPARVLGSDGGTLREGRAADVVLIDPEAEYVIDRNRFYSKGRNTPFHGRKVTGRVVMTILDGRVVYANGKITEGENQR